MNEHLSSALGALFEKSFRGKAGTAGGTAVYMFLHSIHLPGNEKETS
jgi:hypothetical protein